MRGLMDSETLLGQLPRNWFIRFYGIGRRDLPRYYNTDTKVVTVDDPRLAPLPREWQRVDREVTADDPEHVDFF